MTVSSLGQLVTNLKLEAGQSSSAAAGINMRDQLVYILNRTQEELAINYDWPFLTVDRDVLLAVGTRYYAYPSDLPFDAVDVVWSLWDTVVQGLAYGIGPEQMTAWNSDLGQSSWPPQRWMNNADTNLIEIWPIPSQANPATPTSLSARVRLRGTRAVPRMVADEDMCVLPDTIILMFAAAELLARQKAADAPMKMAKAKDYMRRMKIRQAANKQNSIKLSVGGCEYQEPRVGLEYIPIGYGSGPGA